MSTFAPFEDSIDEPPVAVRAVEAHQKHLMSAAESRRQELHSKSLDPNWFETALEGAQRLSINTGVHGALMFLRSGYYCNAIQWRILQLRQSPRCAGMSDRELWHRAVGEFTSPKHRDRTTAEIWEARFAFEQELGIGPDAKYGALSFGGKGLEYHGKVQLVFSVEAGRHKICVDGDSVDLPSGIAADSMIAPIDKLADMLFVKRQSAVEASCQAQSLDHLSTQLGQKRSSIEIILHGPLTVGFLTSIRILYPLSLQFIDPTPTVPHGPQAVVAEAEQPALHVRELRAAAHSHGIKLELEML